ncbi:MAG TPA: RNA-directed DNA polymerase [Pyrinomonadaceae bacterium]|nr:RNA-directed DNA polymerase [Pyrinomonadaceae bacterium]
MPAPQPGFLVRPGADLSHEDQVIFAALVAAIRPELEEAFFWEGEHPDFAYRLHNEHTDVEWFQHYFPLWERFDARSIEIIDSGRPYVVVADIAGYYELIDLFTLRSDLNGLDVDSETLALLMTCLHRWARVQRRGVPQGFSASDVLAKLYLNAVDVQLRAEGFVHFRWVDDFRIFCRSESEARRVLLILPQILGARELVLQAHKTRILAGEQARAKFQEVHALLDPIHRNFIASLVELEVIDGPSITTPVLDDILAQIQEDEPLEVLTDAYHTYFTLPQPRFNKTLFRYLLGRLGGARNPFALEDAIRQLRIHPEESDTIAEYAAKVDGTRRFEDAFLELRDEGLLPFDYHLYQVMRWRLRQEGTPTESFLRLARFAAVEPGGVWYVKAVGRAVVGRWGGPADLERRQQVYPDAQSDQERAEIICALHRMERGRRNAFLGHVAGDGEFSSRAVRAVREGRVRWTVC